VRETAARALPALLLDAHVVSRVGGRRRGVLSSLAPLVGARPALRAAEAVRVVRRRALGGGVENGGQRGGGLNLRRAEIHE
jgi:hypothetical protein